MQSTVVRRFWMIGLRCVSTAGWLWLGEPLTTEYASVGKLAKRIQFASTIRLQLHLLLRLCLPNSPPFPNIQPESERGG